jgi:hypothetical protein
MQKGILATLMLALMMSLSSCDLVAGIFKAGVGVGIFIVIVIVAVVIFVIAKLFGGNKNA